MRAILLSLVAATTILMSSTKELEPNLRVVDGDTLHNGSDYLRIADVDAPELLSYKCRKEYDLATRATETLRGIIASNNYTITDLGRRDRYGRKLVLLHHRGASYSALLIKLGFGRPYKGGKRRSWCN